jgi:hypothetical protein
MEATTVFAKTDKGRDEIERRTHRLPFASRTVLIMVDGAKNAESLSAIRPDALDILDSLVENGFIEIVGAGVPRVMPIEAPTATAAPATPAPGPTPTRTGLDLKEIRRVALRMVNNTLGPTGQSIAIAMEDAKTLGDFMRAAERARDAIRLRAGDARANEFWQSLGL